MASSHRVCGDLSPWPQEANTWVSICLQCGVLPLELTARSVVQICSAEESHNPETVGSSTEELGTCEHLPHAGCLSGT